MSCSFPLSIVRRSLLLALLGWPLATLSAVTLPHGLRRWGRGEYRRFGFLVYEASLWAGEDPQHPPLALRLDYRRSISGDDIVRASIDAMRPLVAADAPIDAWAERMRSIFPDVQEGDHLLGVWQDDGARFYQGERLIGEVADAAFARAFFGIWLHVDTAAPALRRALLRSPA